MEFFDFVKKCSCAATSTAHIKEFLISKGFVGIDCKAMPICFDEGSYVIDLYGNALIACKFKKNSNKLRICASHIDSPALCIKPSPEIRENGVTKLNVEVYGGPILYSFFDRPLSIAGKVAYLVGDDVVTKIIDFMRPILTIPSLAIHMNRDVNDGFKINKQSDMLPIISSLEDIDFNEIICKECNISKDALLDFELYVYNCEESTYVGYDDEFISSPRIDNLSSTFAILNALLETDYNDNINMAIFFDNEEIGSHTKQGADSFVVSYVIKRICESLNLRFEDAVLNGIMISADVAHATHPNHSEKNDITNKIFMNKGLVIKRACSQSYATDCKTIAYIKQICDNNDISYQVFVNRSDIRGGSTLGSIISSNLPMETVDIGAPILAMHSARELMGKKDLEYIEQLIHIFYGRI